MNNSHSPISRTSLHNERATQDRVIKLFRDKLRYRFLGDRHDLNNSNIEVDLLTNNLEHRGYGKAEIIKAINRLQNEAWNSSRSLYDNNKKVYELLRYGIQIKNEPGKVTETVRLIDWKNLENNDFAFAEEVTLRRGKERRPDIVLYVNGIAIGVLELKSSSISIGHGIRQNISNQRPEFNSWFFSTVQFIFAGNDSEGLQYGTIGTAEKYFLKWKEDEAEDTGYKLDKYLHKMCNKQRLIELMYDFVLFDGGVKKLPRVHQYIGIKKAQEHIAQNKGGIIWHTQGSGKSIVMVLLAKWILENNSNARILIVTDRDELDTQIKNVFTDAGETIYRTSNGRDLMKQLAEPAPRLLCSLIHKFGKRDVDNFDKFIEELKSQPGHAVGEFFVFVDECHRTQSGKLHKVMTTVMPDAVFIGFTGTPLLKKDKKTSLEVFGDYIHTYKFGEAVEDKVILDLVYEARDIDQHIGSQDKIDQWFEAKTKGLNDWKKDKLKKEWSTRQNVLSSISRTNQIVNDILFDFSVKPRLSNERGNAMLIASSIYDACKYFSLFQNSIFKNQCAIITSYRPHTKDITVEDTGANTQTDKEVIYNTYTELLKNVASKPNMSPADTYEEEAKDKFKKEPAQMKLLIVVDKLLTGFDAPSCTYLYIDKKMQDHGLFQAICRTNRLDSEDKNFGYIVDYKDLFKKVEKSISVYTSELDHTAPGASSEVLIKDRVTTGRERLEEAFETIRMLCEPVEPPKDELKFIRYFCGNPEIDDDLAAHAYQRAALYKATASLIRAFSNIADDLDTAGYTVTEIKDMRREVHQYEKLHDVICLASGESLDLTTYEADMRQLIDMYISADESRKISPFDEMPLLDVIMKLGITEAIDNLPEETKGNKGAVSEIIDNNVRSKIVKEHLNDPAYFEKMSQLLDEIIADRKQDAIEYEEYLNRIAELVKKVQAGKEDDLPAKLDTPGRRALYHNLNNDEELAIKIDEIVKEKRTDDWRDNQTKENLIKAELFKLLSDQDEVERVFLIIKQQSEY